MSERSSPSNQRTPPRTARRPFDGLTAKMWVLVVFLCLVNAVRKMGPQLKGGVDFADWFIQVFAGTAWGLIVAVPIVLAVVAAYNLAPPRPSRRHATVALAFVVSSAVGVAVALVVDPRTDCGINCPFNSAVELFTQTWARYGALWALLTVVFVFLRTADESVERAHEAERERARFVQRMEEARLKMLQAQVEPHFLFNTLANVRRLYQTAPSDAATMLDNLMRYLEVALPEMRVSDSTLGREVGLTESYLNVQKIRMSRRLTFDIDLPERLRGARLPPMMLLTLAENAIKHGLAPLAEGGAVHITASATANALHVSVADTGAGFTKPSGGGTGLANIRARLAAMYGAAGQLTFAPNAPRGVVATITVPLSSMPSAAAIA